MSTTTTTTTATKAADLPLRGECSYGLDVLADILIRQHNARRMDWHMLESARPQYPVGCPHEWDSVDGYTAVQGSWLLLVDLMACSKCGVTVNVTRHLVDTAGAPCFWDGEEDERLDGHITCVELWDHYSPLDEISDGGRAICGCRYHASSFGDMPNEIIDRLEAFILEKAGTLDGLHEIHRIEYKLALVSKLIRHGLQQMDLDLAAHGAYVARVRHKGRLEALDAYSDKLIAARRRLAPDGEYPEGVPRLTKEMLATHNIAVPAV